MDIRSLKIEGFPRWRQLVRHRPARSILADDQPALNEATGQRSEGLIGIEAQQRQLMLGRVRIAFDLAQSIPLNQTDAKRRQRFVKLSMMTVLNALDEKAKDFRRG